MIAGMAMAADHDMVVIPVELYACNYHEGKGEADLNAAIDKWNAWADDQKENTYAAWTLNKWYYGQDQDFDVLWLGAGTTSKALGKSQDDYLKNDAGLIEAFGSAVMCDAHVKMASVIHKEPPKGDTPKDSILTFSDCSYKEGATFAKLGVAMAEWSKYMSDNGSKAGIWHWYPVYGGGDEEFDFKWIEAHADLESVGSDFDIIGNGRGFEVYNRVLGHMIDCDSSRAYLARSHRHVQLRK